MPKVIQIRNVPDPVHRRLRSQAALAGQSLSEYLLAEIMQIAERPTLQEMRERLKGRLGVTLSTAPADIVRAGRDGR